jgi:hypothetical protein
MAYLYLIRENVVFGYSNNRVLVYYIENKQFILNLPKQKDIIRIIASFFIFVLIHKFHPEGLIQVLRFLPKNLKNCLKFLCAWIIFINYFFFKIPIQIYLKIIDFADFLTSRS